MENQSPLGTTEPPSPAFAVVTGSVLERRKRFADEICATISKFYAEGMEYSEVAAFLAHQAYGAIDQVEDRDREQRRAHMKLGDAHALIAVEFPGWLSVESSPAPNTTVSQRGQ